MQLAGPVFLLFFACVALLYHLLPPKCGPFVLFGAGLLFCASWGPWMLLPPAGVLLVSYFTARRAANYPAGKKRSLVTACGLVLLFGGLFVFKYASWIARTAFSFEWDILLPVGISFYTLQAAGYLIDVKRNLVPAEKNPLTLALFLSYFPQLLSGPISRASVLLPALRSERRWDGARASAGAKRILFGLFEKLAVADMLGTVTDGVFSDPAAASGPLVIYGAILFGTQLLCDFRGYTHIAVGCSQILGIPLPENFDHPFGAYSVREFWKRWHISLTSWFRDYVYIPLGGNRKGTARTCLHIVLVFVLSGLWHGASLTFLVWGLLHALYQIAERFLFRNPAPPKKVLRILRTAGTFASVSFAWIFFRASSLSDAWTLVSSLFTGWSPGAVGTDRFLEVFGLTSNAWIPLLCSGVLFLLYSVLVPHLGGGKKSARVLKHAFFVLLLWYTVFAWIYLQSRGVPSNFLYAQF